MAGPLPVAACCVLPEGPADDEGCLEGPAVLVAELALFFTFCLARETALEPEALREVLVSENARAAERKVWATVGSED